MSPGVSTIVIRTVVLYVGACAAGAVILFYLIFFVGFPALFHEPHVSGVEADVVARDSANFLKGRCGTATSAEIPQSGWPSSLRALEPSNIRLEPEGLYVTTSSFLESEWGVFVPCEPATFAPKGGSDPRYTSVGSGVFTYYVAG
jgi:hypothetical protein